MNRYSEYRTESGQTVILDNDRHCTIPTDRANADYRAYLIDTGQWSEPGADPVAE